MRRMWSIGTGRRAFAAFLGSNADSQGAPPCLSPEHSVTPIPFSAGGANKLSKARWGHSGVKLPHSCQDWRKG